MFPPLVGVEWVTGDESQLIGLILNGISGEIEVKGTTYNGAMPPWANSLNDIQIAAVLSHIRSNWGNSPSYNVWPVTSLVR